MAARTLETSFSIDDATALSVAYFREEHVLGRPPRLEIEVHYAQYFDPEDMIGHGAALEYAYEGGTTRVFAGVVDEVTVLGSSGVGAEARTSRYLVAVVTPLTLMGRDRGNAIYQDMTVQDIATAVLKEEAPSLPVVWRLTATYAPRAYCVRYQESALAFLSRLFEHEGIYFFLETTSDGDASLVIADDSTAAEAIEGDATLPRRARSLLAGDSDAVFSIADRRGAAPGKFTLRDFAFETPKLDLTSTAAVADDADLEIYDYPGGYFTPGDGTRLANVRLEAAQATRSTVSIDAECTRVSAGRKLTISESNVADGDWLVAAVVHQFVNEKADESYARAELIPAKTKFRPPRVTPRPVVEGPQTAIVVAPAGSQPEEIHTDKYGRAKVKFHWDLGPDTDDKASAWMRVTQLQTSGSMMLPRVGWEVIVEFLEGDPDRPLVTGRFYNGVFMPPYALPEGKTRTSLQTASSPGGGGTNEVRFEDKAGAEEIMIHSQYDTNIAVANNKTKNVGNSDTLEVKVDSSTSIGGDDTVKVTKGYKTQIKGDQKVTVAMTRTMEVNAVAGFTIGGSSTTMVGAVQTEHIGNPLEAVLALAAAKATEVVTAKAADAVSQVTSAVQGKIDQALGPVQDLAAAAGALGVHMDALKGGDMSATGPLLAGATALPAASAVASSMNGSSSSGGPAATHAAEGTDESAGQIAGQNVLDSAIGNFFQSAASKADNALEGGDGADADGGGGSSEANVAGPVGDVDGVDQTDRAKGPGHSTLKVTGSYNETAAALKVLATVNGINTNVAGNTTQSAGAAHIELVMGDFAEAVQGNKMETEVGLIVVAKGESEHVAGAKTQMVGGAIIDKVKGNLTIEAAANLTMIGAMHKLDASSSITLTCGASTITIDGGGVTIQSPMITLTGGTIQLPKPVAEAG